MTRPLATIRRRQSAWGRRFLSAFAAAWLAVVMQPCAMALSIGDDHDCPHCPPVELPPCHAEATTPDCGLEDRVAAEPRTTALKLKDLPGDLPVATLPAAYSLAPATRRLAPPYRTQLRIDPSGPPRNVLFCTWLK